MSSNEWIYGLVLMGWCLEGVELRLTGAGWIGGSSTPALVTTYGKFRANQKKIQRI